MASARPTVSPNSVNKLSASVASAPARSNPAPLLVTQLMK